MKIIFDLDDFSDANNIFPDLLRLKGILPNLKVNLFTIPAKTSSKILLKITEEEWIHVIPHGFEHNNNYEFAKLSYVETAELLGRFISDPIYKKGFKAPGWQISIETMEWLKSHGWWVAIQWSDGRFFGHPDGPYQPKPLLGLKYYALNDVKPPFRAIHGHCQNVCGNGLLELWDELIKIDKNAEFIFIQDYIHENTGNG